MLDPTINERLSWSYNSGQYPPAETGIAPLRYDIARARYLQKQRADRESTIGRLDFQTRANRWYEAIPRAGRLLSRHLSSLRRAAF
ncbi:hypothetical protein ACMDCR_28860 [Labrys okinawensis]|uniref:hypothetical protein n=1 Tax=Labrys okinawensis TaxID=346911 RepID=UPI0039BD21D6